MDRHNWARPPVEDDSDVNRRRRARNPVQVTADFRKIGRTPFRVRVTDLSQSGCRCESTAKVYVGDCVWIGVEGLAPVEAIIRWANPFGFGCEWAHPMHVSVLDHICQLHPELG